MIRKIFLSIFCLYLAIWIVIAYSIKSELQTFSGAIDGFDLTYKEIKISGFPNKWNFTFVHPVIRSEDKYITLNLNSILLTINLTFTKFKLDPSKEIAIQLADDDSMSVYDVSFDYNPQIIIKRKNNFFSKDTFYGFVSFAIAENIMDVQSEEKSLFKIDNKNFSIVRKDKEDITLFITDYDLYYAGTEDLLGFSKLRLGALYELSLGFDKKDKKYFLTSLDSKRFDIVVDEEAELHLAGKLDFVRDDFPSGIFTLDLVRADKLVDLLWWSSFDLTTSDIKKMIAKANGNQLSDNVSLPVVFSTSGLTVGSSSWQELKRGD